MTTAYPLEWPEGWQRTPASRLVDGRGHFGKMRDRGDYTSKGPLTFAEARDSLTRAAAKIGVHNLVLSTNFTLGQNGLPRGDRRRPEDEGVAVYFTRNGRQMVMARDAYQRAEENMRSLAMALEAMAQLERHGGTGISGRAFQGFTALPSPKKPHEILGIPADADEAVIRRAWRDKIGEAHPDADGGSDMAAAEINAARDAMLRSPR